jgi:hypothetical protein
MAAVETAANAREETPERIPPQAVHSKRRVEMVVFM